MQLLTIFPMLQYDFMSTLSGGGLDCAAVCSAWDDGG